MPKIIGYIRVSTADQDNSLEVQTEQIMQYAKLFKLDIAGIEVDDGISAKNMDRPGLQRCMDRMRSGDVNGILVVKLDRLSRSIRDMGDMVNEFFDDRSKFNCELHCIAEHIDTRSAMGRVVMNILMAFAQGERELTSERTSAVLQHKKRNNVVYGRTPYEFDRVGHSLVPNAERLAVKERMRCMREEGLAFGAIARRLNADGVLTPMGKTWSDMSVYRILDPKRG